jgi:hypothetical protein
VKIQLLGIPNGIPRILLTGIFLYFSKRYINSSDYPGPPTLNDKARQVRALSHLTVPSSPTAKTNPSPHTSMLMPMMHIRKMRMPMPHRRMHMRMTVRLRSIPFKPVRMLVMFVMCMAMIMLEQFVLMLMNMVLHQVNPYPHGH